MPKCVLNTADFVVEDFDSDFVLLNTMTGNYFEVSEKAASLFRGLLEGICPQETVEKLRGISAEIASEAESLIHKLEAAEVFKIEENSAMPAVSAETTVGALGGVGAFIFEGFDDLAELILADPVHDVDLETGQMIMTKNEV